jgi:hypothetical protein
LESEGHAHDPPDQSVNLQGEIDFIGMALYLRRMVKARTPSPELLEKIAKATPPPRFPRGYFDPLVTPTRLLLDKGFKLHQAADLLIEERVIKPQDRFCFLQAMRGRISRLKRQQVSAGGFAWSASLYYDSTHLVQEGGRKALCGSTATAWEAERSESNRCARCIGLARKHGIVTF